MFSSQSISAFALPCKTQKHEIEMFSLYAVLQVLCHRRQPVAAWFHQFFESQLTLTLLYNSPTSCNQFRVQLLAAVF